MNDLIVHRGTQDRRIAVITLKGGAGSHLEDQLFGGRVQFDGRCTWLDQGAQMVQHPGHNQVGLSHLLKFCLPLTNNHANG